MIKSLSAFVAIGFEVHLRLIKSEPWSGAETLVMFKVYWTFHGLDLFLRTLSELCLDCTFLEFL